MMESRQEKNRCEDLFEKTSDISQAIHNDFCKIKKRKENVALAKNGTYGEYSGRIMEARAARAGQAEQVSKAQEQNIESKQVTETVVDTAEQQIENTNSRRVKSERFKKTARKVVDYLARNKQEVMLNDEDAMRKVEGYESVYDPAKKVNTVTLSLSTWANASESALKEAFGNRFIGKLTVPGENGDTGDGWAMARTELGGIKESG